MLPGPASWQPLTNILIAAKFSKCSTPPPKANILGVANSDPSPEPSGTPTAPSLITIPQRGLFKWHWAKLPVPPLRPAAESGADGLVHAPGVEGFGQHLRDLKRIALFDLMAMHHVDRAAVFKQSDGGRRGRIIGE